MEERWKVETEENEEATTSEAADLKRDLKRVLSVVINRAHRKSQVMQCLGFCTANFWSSLAYASAEQKPKHCLT